jgi:hypothetical protein
MAWIGWTLGFCITVIEIVFNKPGVRKNFTLWLVGALAYLYGMYTNIIGIWAAQGSPAGGIIIWIFPIVLGVAIEMIPEVLFVWAILGDVTQEGDFIGNVIKMFNGEKDDEPRKAPAAPGRKPLNMMKSAVDFPQDGQRGNVVGH